MQIVLISNDLMVVSRLTSATTGIGAEFRVAANATAATALHEEQPADVVVIDLGLAALELEKFVSSVKSNAEHPVQVMAFGPHVHADRLAAARDAGCDVVLSRGQFFAQVDSILSRLTR